MKKQREQVDQHKGKLESDIQNLKTQISALKVRIPRVFEYALTDDRRQKAKYKNHKRMHHRKVHELLRKYNHLTALQEALEVSIQRYTSLSSFSIQTICVQECLNSKKATNVRTQASRIPLPTPSCSPSKYERLPRADGALALTIKTHVKKEEVTMVTEIRRPSKSKLSHLTRDSRF